MRNPIDVLNSLSDKSKNPTYRFERLYRNLYNPEFYMLAYKNIYANEGSMTPGMDGTTLDGMSSRRIDGIIASLKDRSYQPNPARREYISHECAHYIMDRAVPSAAFHREFDGERAYTQEDFKNLFSFRETQVDRMGAALLMPRFMVHNAAAMHGCTDRIPVYGDSVLRTADKLRIKQMANAMGVSFSAFLIRLRELGCLCYRPLAEYITEEMGLGQDGGAG